MQISNNSTLPLGVYIREYKILSVLGQGTFGITYLAVDKNLNKKVAIKEFYPSNFVTRGQGFEVLPRAKSDVEDYIYGLKSFIIEAKTLASFDHKNIVKILKSPIGDQ